MKMMNHYLKGIGWILGSFVVFLILLSFCYYVNLFSSSVISYLKLLFPMISMMLGGIFIGRRSKQKGWLEGIKLALVPLVLFFLLSYLGFGISLNLKMFFYQLILLLSCIFGSILGINRQKTPK